MGFWAGTYGLNFCHDFVKLFLNIEKMIIFMGNIILFSIGAQEQKLCPNKLKTGERERERQQKNNSKFEFNLVFLIS